VLRDAGVPDHLVAAWHGHDELVMRRTYSHAHSEELAVVGSALARAMQSPTAAPDDRPGHTKSGQL